MLELGPTALQKVFSEHFIALIRYLNPLVNEEKKVEDFYMPTLTVDEYKILKAILEKTSRNKLSFHCPELSNSQALILLQAIENNQKITSKNVILGNYRIKDNFPDEKIESAPISQSVEVPEVQTDELSALTSQLSQLLSQGKEAINQDFGDVVEAATTVCSTGFSYGRSLFSNIGSALQSMMEEETPEENVSAQNKETKDAKEKFAPK